MWRRSFIHVDQETFDAIVDGYPGLWAPRWFRVWFTRTLFRVSGEETSGA